MSAATWDGPLAPNHDPNGPFNGTIDPSAMDFNPSPDFDFGQMSGTPIPQHMHNGIQRNGSPGTFQQPPYQTTSIVPAKRPHTDTISNSPRQASRSLTPQQPHFPSAFPPSMNGQPTANGFQNFNQVNSTTASPSPVIPNQQFMNGVHQQRVSTASPSPFSPAATNAGLQMSPAPSDFSNSGDPAQNGMSNFARSNPYMNGHGAGSPAMNTPNNPMTPQGGQMGPHAVPRSSNMSQEEQARRMQMIRAVNQQQGGMAGNGMAMGAGGPGGPRPGMQQPNMAALPPQLQQQQAQAMQQLQAQLTHPVQPMKEGFMPAVAQFNQQRNMPFTQNLFIAGRQVHPMNLWILVMSHGGSAAVNQKRMWPTIAAKLQVIPPPQGADHTQVQIACSNMVEYWKQNFYQFERQKMMEFSQKKANLMQRFQQQAAQVQGMHGGPPRQMQGQMPSTPGPQNPAVMHMRRTSGIEAGQPQISPQMYPNQAGGFPQGQVPRPGTQGSMTMAMPQQPHVRTPSRPQAKRTPSTSLPDDVKSKPAEPEPLEHKMRKPTLSDPFQSEAYFFYRLPGQPSHLEHWGPLCLEDREEMRIPQNLTDWRPIQPLLRSGVPGPPLLHPEYFPRGDTGSLGPIDIHSLNMSIKSGIAAEVRVALDTVSQLALAHEDLFHIPLPLRLCDDLLISLMECATVNLEKLEAHADKVSEDVNLLGYEELADRVRSDSLGLQDIPASGTEEYELENVADRLLCIIQILQNLSCADDKLKYPNNIEMDRQGRPLASFSYRSIWLENIRELQREEVVDVVTRIIRSIGTRKSLLRSHRNTLDFYKDTVMYLSNVANRDFKLSSKEDAASLIYFLNTFGPSPEIAESDPVSDITFFSQDATTQPYLRFAVDALAKIIVLDEPNRTFFRSVLTGDDSGELLTKTFGLALAPLPDLDDLRQNIAIVGWRRSYLKQGLLAADILVGIVPPTSASLARSWFHSADCWPSRLVCLLRMMGFGRDHSQTITEHDLCLSLAERALSVLLQVSDRVREDENERHGSLKSSIRQTRLINSEVLRKAHLAWGPPNPQEIPEVRTRIRGVLRQIETLQDAEV